MAHWRLVAKAEGKDLFVLSFRFSKTRNDHE